MNTNDFQSTLTRDGFNDIDTREMEPNLHVSEHDHPFDARAMVLGGQITLTVDGTEKIYREGDSFEMTAGCVHQEDVGSNGVRYMVGRRYPADAPQ